MKRTRWLVAATIATLVAFLISSPVRAGENTTGTSPAADGTAASANGGPNDSAEGTKPSEPGPAPSLQMQDEGPAPGVDRSRSSRVRLTPVGDTEERPFWKSPVFWIVAGALVAGAVGMLAYSSSGSRGDLAPCPVDVEVSLGCFGAGR